MQIIKLQAKDHFFKEAVLKTPIYCIGLKVRQIHCVHLRHIQAHLKHQNQVHQEKFVEL